MTMRLDISVGPVQGFVAQSRRTRDLWGSSYLLSFLSAHAMHGAREAGGLIVQPSIDDDPLYRWVAGNRTGDPPRIGSVPNHFVADVDGNAAAVAHAGISALNVAWKRVCDAVWAHFVNHADTAGNGTDRIWQRQIRNFWDVNWTAGDSAAGSGLLARRKHWRSQRPPDEPGDKCTVMHDLQELSGYVRAENSDSRQRQDRFWDAVRARPRLGPLDLRDHERVCAIALVKRLFARVAQEALDWPLDTSHWPSTVYVGAVPWFRRAVRTAPEAARRYAQAVQERARDGVLAERRPPFAGLDEEAGGDFARLDANYLHREFVLSERLCPLASDTDHTECQGHARDDRDHPFTAGPHDRAIADGGSDARDTLIRFLDALCDTADGAGGRLGPPPSFYALLLADGDRLGRLVGKLGGKQVGQSLSTFTNRVPGIVRDRDGVTVYAGGDDVLAMLPATHALACAAALSSAYTDAFADMNPAAVETKTTATLSAAVVFAHIRVPLNAVISEARHLLDDVAKDANGRDSLAVGVLKPGGLNCQWVTAWTRPDSGSSATTVLAGLTRQLERGGSDGGLSSSLIYRIRDTLTRLCGWPAWEPGGWGELPVGLDLRTFLRAEILQSLTGRSVEGAETRTDELTDLVWELLRRARKSADGERYTDADEFGVDALLLARFLASPEHDGTGT